MAEKSLEQGIDTVVAKLQARKEYTGTLRPRTERQIPTYFPLLMALIVALIVGSFAGADYGWGAAIFFFICWGTWNLWELQKYTPSFRDQDTTQLYDKIGRQSQELKELLPHLTEEETKVLTWIPLLLDKPYAELDILPGLVRRAMGQPHLSQTEFFHELAAEYKIPTKEETNTES